MSTNKRYDWKEIQKYYDDGHSRRDVTKHFGVSSGSIQKAVERGDLKTRSVSEGNRLFHQKNPNAGKAQWTPERRKAQSERKKKLYAEFPEKHPNRKLANNRSKMSYPERSVYDWLKSQSVGFIHQRKIDRFYADFCIGKLVIEVDSEFHHDPEYDSQRDAIIESYGFTVKRFPAKAILKFGPKIVLDGSVSDEIIHGYIELRKPRECIICEKTHYEKRKTCSDECLKILRSVAPKGKAIKKRIVKELPVTKEDLQVLVDTMPMTHIGKKFGVSDSAVRKWCKKYDIITKKPDPCTVNELSQCIADGMYLSEIARKFGTNRERIKTFAKKHDMKIKRLLNYLSPKAKRQVRDYINDGLRNAEICKLMRLTQHQVSEIRCAVRSRN